MLTYDEVLNLNYYKKTTYSGWINGMRFLIRCETPGEGCALFHAFAWPGPYTFDLTADEEKSDVTAPFTEEGKRTVVDWINGQYEAHPERWSHERKILLP